MTWTKTRRKIQAILIFLCCIRQVRSLLKGVCHDRSLLQVAWLDIDMIYLYSKNRKLNIESELRISIIYIFHHMIYTSFSTECLLFTPRPFPSSWNVWITDLDDIGGIWSFEILAVLETPKSPPFGAGDEGRKIRHATFKDEDGKGCLICVEKTHVLNFIPYTGLPWITLLLKGFFVVSLFGVYAGLNFCHDNQPPAGGREVSSGPCSTWTGVQKEHPWPLLFTEKKGGRFWRVDLAGLLLNLWKVSGRWSPLRFVHWQALYNSLLRHLKGTHTLQRFQASLQEEYSDAFIEFL